MYAIWDPSRFAAKTSELEIWHGLLLMGRLCWCVIHGVGFRPQKVLWQWDFCPLLADIVLIVGLIFFFFKSEFSLKICGRSSP